MTVYSSFVGIARTCTKKYVAAPLLAAEVMANLQLDTICWKARTCARKNGETSLIVVGRQSSGFGLLGTCAHINQSSEPYGVDAVRGDWQR